MTFPIVCSRTAGGQSSFTEGLVQTLGFTPLPIDEIEPYLKRGQPVLLNGWWPEFKKIADHYPGKGFVVWHSSWAASELMNEGQLLGACLERLRKGTIRVFWLDGNDVLPEGAERLQPVWSSDAMRELAKPRPPKRHGEVVAGLHGNYPSGVKNPLATIVSCLAAGAAIHTGSATLLGTRGAALLEILRGKTVITHEALSRVDTAKLLASVDLLVHPSFSETWPYMPMEAVYSGTPVVLSYGVPWTLSEWARNLCMVESRDTLRLTAKIRHLLKSEADWSGLLVEQEMYLDRVAKENTASAARTLALAGFPVKR